MSTPDVSILGLGASGRAAARLALAHGRKVHVSELKTDARTATLADELTRMGAQVELGVHDLSRIAGAGVVVVSPGIPPEAPVLVQLRARGVRWISEPEFAVRFYQAPLIAITGTNGKTTTTLLTAHLLNAAGIRAAVGGNVGGGMAPPASELALLDPPPAWYVLEMSSFQLADTVTFSPRIGVVTNLAPDHLDRYSDIERYYGDKARLFQNAHEGSRWVLNAEDSAVMGLPGEAPGMRCLFGLRAGEGHGVILSASVEGGIFMVRDPEAGEVRHPLIPVSEWGLLGRHNQLNALAAALAARLAGASPEGIAAGLRSFRPLPHRLEPVARSGGVLWVNDSKATNVAAAMGGIGSLEGELVVILGGKDKGEDFRPLAPLLRERARSVVLYGAAAGRLEAELREGWQTQGATTDLPSLWVTGGLEEAVAEARRSARAGTTVLLAPACSSFDLFASYEERGTRFAELAAGVEGS
jgi:UDP-N-acetylmuramoylalanine--D-glutamate ligase